MTHLLAAPALEVSEWINTASPLTLDELKGKVVVIHAFQMLCPGCISHGIPQAIAMYNGFSREEVVVLGLHSVFEHHAAMTPEALKAFVHQYRITFHVAVDQARRGNFIPKKMDAYQLQGTPSLIIIDKKGMIRLNHFGYSPDILVGALIGKLIAEHPPFDKYSSKP